METVLKNKAEGNHHEAGQVMDCGLPSQHRSPRPCWALGRKVVWSDRASNRIPPSSEEELRGWRAAKSWFTGCCRGVNEDGLQGAYGEGQSLSTCTGVL